MKRLFLALSLVAVALSGCAQLKEWSNDAGGGGSGETRPYPKSSSDLGLG